MPASVAQRLVSVVAVSVIAVAAVSAAGWGVPPAAAADSWGRLTPEARRAGVRLGNAPMGWRQRAVPNDRVGSTTSGDQQRTTAAYTPSGVLGIDVSSYQGNVRWSTYAKQGKQFAFVKATEGTSYRNPYFTSQYSGANKAGLIRGAYHFANPAGKSGAAQARYFVKYGGGWSADGRTLPGVLDVEYNPYGSTCYGLSKAKMVSWIASFTTEYEKLTGRETAIYSTTDWWSRCTGNSTKFADNPLWIARWGSTTPGTLPRGWSEATFWQYSATPIDQNWFNGSYAELEAFSKNE